MCDCSTRIIQVGAGAGGATSSFTDNGNGTFTHNDGAGTVVTFDVTGAVDLTTLTPAQTTALTQALTFTDLQAGQVTDLMSVLDFTQLTPAQCNDILACFDFTNLTAQQVTDLAAQLSPQIVPQSIGDADGDTQIVPVEGGGAGGGDRLDFVVDNTTLMSLEAGKLTLNGIFIDPPTGMELVPQAANPGPVPANTIWINSADGHIYRGSIDLEAAGAAISTDANNIIVAGTDAGVFLNSAAITAALTAAGMSDLLSTDANNIIVVGTDGKLYATVDFSGLTAQQITDLTEAVDPAQLTTAQKQAIATTLLSVDGDNTAALGTDSLIYVPPIDFSTLSAAQITALTAAIDYTQLTAQQITDLQTALGLPDVDTIVSTDANNFISAGTDGGAFLDSSNIHADDDVETVTGYAVNVTDTRNPIIEKQWEDIFTGNSAYDVTTYAGTKEKLVIYCDSGTAQDITGLIGGQTITLQPNESLIIHLNNGDWYPERGTTSFANEVIQIDDTVTSSLDLIDATATDADIKVIDVCAVNNPDPQIAGSVLGGTVNTGAIFSGSFTPTVTGTYTLELVAWGAPLGAGGSTSGEFTGTAWFELGSTFVAAPGSSNDIFDGASDPMTNADIGKTWQVNVTAGIQTNVYTRVAASSSIDFPQWRVTGFTPQSVSLTANGGTQVVTGDADSRNWNTGDKILAIPTKVLDPATVQSYTQPNSAPNTVTAVIVPGVVELQRGNSGGLFNTVTEASWTGGTSPGDTLWRNDTVTTFTNFQNAYSGAIGDNILESTYQGAQLQVISTGEIFNVEFTAWQDSGGGGFAFTVSSNTKVDGWHLIKVPQPSLDEINQNVTTADIGTAAPTGAKKGINPATGDDFYVDTAGNWQAATASGITINNNNPNTTGDFRFDNITLSNISTQQGARGFMFLQNNEIYATGIGGNDSPFGDTETTYRFHTVPVQDKGTDPLVELSYNYRSAFVRDSAGVVWGWGNNLNGVLGLGDTTFRNVPTKVQWFIDNGITIQAIVGGPVYNSGGSDCHFFLGNNGRVYGTGYNGYGQLGDGSTTASNIPVEANLPVGVEIVKLAVSTNDRTSVYAIDNTGQLYVWGLNDRGHLGLGNTTNQTTPQAVTGFTNVVDIKASGVDAGTTEGQALLLRADGTIWGTGQNDLGQLGIGNAINPNIWTQESSGKTDWVWFDTGAGDNSIAIDAAGDFYVTGLNNYGQVSDGTVTNATVFTKPLLDFGGNNLAFQGKAAYGMVIGSHVESCIAVVDTDGNLYTSGYGGNGLRGVGTYVSGNTNDVHRNFTRVYMSEPVSALKAAGHLINEHAWVVLSEDGRLFAWGHADFGQIALENDISRIPYPVEIWARPLALGIDQATIVQTLGSGSTTEVPSVAAVENYVANNTVSEIDTTVTAADIGTAAPVGAKEGRDPITGDAFYVDNSGNWQAGIADTAAIKVDANSAAYIDTLPTSTNSGVIRNYINIDVTNTATLAVQVGETLNGVIDGTFPFSNYAVGTQFRADEVIGGWVVSATTGGVLTTATRNTVTLDHTTEIIGSGSTTFVYDQPTPSGSQVAINGLTYYDEGTRRYMAIELVLFEDNEFTITLGSNALPATATVAELDAFLYNVTGTNTGSKQPGLLLNGNDIIINRDNSFANFQNVRVNLVLDGVAAGQVVQESVLNVEDLETVIFPATPMNDGSSGVLSGSAFTTWNQVFAEFSGLRMIVTANNGKSLFYDQVWDIGNLVLDATENILYTNGADEVQALIRSIQTGDGQFTYQRASALNQVVELRGVRGQKTVINTVDTPVNDQTSSGYIDIGNMRIQWGYNSGGTGTGTQTLPAAFADADYSVVCTIESPILANRIYNISHRQRTTSSFNYEKTFMVSGDNNIGSASGEGFSWQAIGIKP